MQSIYLPVKTIQTSIPDKFPQNTPINSININQIATMNTNTKTISRQIDKNVLVLGLKTFNFRTLPQMQKTKRNFKMQNGTNNNRATKHRFDKTAMKKNITLFLFLLTFFLLPSTSQASHFTGGSIAYECITPDSFRVHLFVYRDCSGILNISNVITARAIGSSCGTVNMQPAWTQVSNTTITPVAPGVITNCTNVNASVTGIEEIHYTRDFGFSPTSCGFVIEHQSCCRNGSVTNLDFNSSYYLYVDTIRPGSLPCNSSPRWNHPGIDLFPSNTALLINHSATDPDGDSLVYSLTSCRSSSTTSSTYNSGYSPSNPLGAGYTTYINPQSGILKITPLTGTVGNYAICVMVEEYRNGIKIGETIRETNLRLTNFTGCSARPTFTGISPSGGAIPTPNTFPADTINLVVTPGQAFTFDLTTNDPDPGALNILSSFLLLPGATLTDTSGNNPNFIFANNPIGQYSWTAPASGTYQEVFILQDTTCNGFGNTALLLNIIVGDTASVWPGDANNDLIANNLDLLALGLAYSNTGPARATTSNTWNGYFATPWQDTIIGAIDHKFQDCNGDGTINNDDTLAINLNYGSTHTKTRHSAARGQATDPPLAMNIPQDSASVGDTLHIPITLGDSTIQANDIYGIAFSINYDASLIDSTTFHIEFAPSWIGNNTNSLNLNHNNFDIASCDGAQVRTDHQSTSGMGQIAIAHFIIIDNIDGKRQTFESKILNLNFANVLLIGLNGEKIPVDPISDSLVIYQLSTETEPIQPTSPNIQLHPNPTRDQVTITSPTAAIQEIQILNLHGQTISKTLINKRNKIKLQLANLSSGMYFIKVRTTTDLSIQRLIIR